MARKNWTHQFTLDASAREVYEKRVTLDGESYRVLVVPDDGTAQFSEGIQKLSHRISLGPRGGGCPMCGK